MKLLFGLLLLLAFAFLVHRLNTRKIEKLRSQGVYPPPGLESDGDVDRLLQLGMKIEAIKVYRAVHHVGLKDAKEAVERRQAELGMSGKLG